MLYKNSETYKKLHEDKSDSIEDGTKTQPRLDGWGNLVDEPPPPPSGNVNDEDYSGDTGGMGNKILLEIEPIAIRFTKVEYSVLRTD